MPRASVVVTLVVMAHAVVAMAPAPARAEPPPPPPRGEPPVRQGEPARPEGLDSPAASQAKAHYNEGQRLYEEGRYDEAIAEFEAADRIKPPPNTLYNSGQAYERLLDYAQSVTWFERY